MSDDFMYTDVGGNYERVIQHDGVRITVCRNRFEIAAMPNSELSEQQIAQAARDWVKWRKEQELRDAGRVPG